MFGGEYRHNKDSKNRVFMPAKLREELGETFVIAKDIREACLKVYSLSGWEEYIAPLKAQNRKLSEKILRFLHSSLTQVTPDSQGRVVIPQELVEYASIERSIVVVGGSDDTTKPGGNALKNLIDTGYKGDIYVVNPKKVDIKIGDVVLLKTSLGFQIFQAAFSLVLPVLAAIAGYFLMPEKESLQVLGILVGFGLTAAIVTITSRYLPPVKSQIDRVL